jgi:hypothetical protein
MPKPGTYRQPLNFNSVSMTKEQADQVTLWCRKNELIRPSVTDEQGWITLTWVMGMDRGNFSTANFKAAMHWCRIMELENSDGVIGYWRSSSG